MVSSSLPVHIADKRRLNPPDNSSHVQGGTIFTANAAGSTSTVVGVNATLSPTANVVRIGEKFKLYTSAGVTKEETVFTITNLVASTSTTVTFSPLAKSATASGDKCVSVSLNNYSDIDNLDDTLKKEDSSYFTDDRLDSLTINDKLYALRLIEDSSGV